MSKLQNLIEDIEAGVKTITGDLTDRVERLESTNDRPGRYGRDDKYSTEQTEYKSVFLDWIRKPADKVRERQLSEAVHDLGKKDVTIGVAADGGYALPEEILNRIEHRERQLNPFVGIVQEQRTSTNDFKALVSMGDGTAGWVGETGTRSATETPDLRERAPTMGEQYAYPQASNWAIQDIFFNVEDWLVNDIAAEWSSQLATAIVSGDGSNKPTGILNTTPVTTADDASPVRAAAAIQFVPLASSSPISLHIDDVIDLVSNVKERYLDRESTAFVMHRLTAAYLRKLKSSTGGDYLWEPSSQDGQPDRLLGYPVYTCDAMGLHTVADAFPIIFGNWMRGYLLARRTDTQITVDPYSNPGYTRFYVRRRIGGCVINNDALKALRIAD